MLGGALDGALDGAHVVVTCQGGHVTGSALDGEGPVAWYGWDPRSMVGGLPKITQFSEIGQYTQSLAVAHMELL